jgi:hypothetical protein
MEQPHTQQKRESHLNGNSRTVMAPSPTAMLWNSLDPSTQNQLAQCLAELIHRIRKAEMVIEKEAADEQ